MAIEIDYDLEPNDLDLLIKLLPEFYNVQSIGPRFRDMNWDEEFRKDMIIGHGFVVKTKPFKKKKRDKDGNFITRGIKEMDGLHSPRFGSDYTDENAFAERYSCECGKKIGRVYEGQVCEECGKKVKFVDVNLKIFAWIKMKNENFKVIHPLMYRKLEVFFGSRSGKTLENMIDFKQDMTLNGDYIPAKDIDRKKNPFYGIGMVEFYNRFEEIMNFYLKRNKNKEEMYKYIMDNRAKIFTTAIPVYSSVLRQVFFNDEDYSYTKIDRCYNSIFGSFYRLNNEEEVTTHNIAKINKNLISAQRKLNDAFDLIFTSLTEREGLIRRNILGGRINFSARTVIIPNARLRSYQIEIPYVCAVELFKEQIINLLVKLNGETFNQAVRSWFYGFVEFDPKIYKVIQYILKHTKGGCKTLLNRNPTINFGSFMCMEIAHVKDDYEDLSAGLPIGCLTSLNADFDGDTLNTVSLLSNEFKKSYSEIFSPRTGLVLSKNDGRLNPAFGLLKDQIIAVRNFCEV